MTVGGDKLVTPGFKPFSSLLNFRFGLEAVSQGKN